MTTRNVPSIKVRHEYSVSGWVTVDGSLVIRCVDMSAIVREYDRRGVSVPASIADLNERGERYSNDSIDCLSAAMSDLYKSDKDIWTRIGRPMRCGSQLSRLNQSYGSQVDSQMPLRVREYLTAQEMTAIDSKDGARERSAWQAHQIMRMLSGQFPGATVGSILEAE